jgi:hypothetical protein
LSHLLSTALGVTRGREERGGGQALDNTGDPLAATTGASIGATTAHCGGRDARKREEPGQTVDKAKDWQRRTEAEAETQRRATAKAITMQNLPQGQLPAQLSLPTGTGQNLRPGRKWLRPMRAREHCVYEGLSNALTRAT